MMKPTYEAGYFHAINNQPEVSDTPAYLDGYRMGVDVRTKHRGCALPKS